MPANPKKLGGEPGDVTKARQKGMELFSSLKQRLDDEIEMQNMLKKQYTKAISSSEKRKLA